MAEKITSKKELKEAILQLEQQQAYEWQLVKDQASVIYENFKPINLIKDLFSQVTSSPRIIEDILGSAVGVISGHISKKIISGENPGLFRNILANASQTLVSRLIMKLPTIFRLAMTNYMHKFVTNKKIQAE
jgi:uncharacterized membrane protein YeaQ/YmgE (transglycosylase-associated protein family)